MPAVALCQYSYAGNPAGIVRKTGVNFGVKINGYIPAVKGALITGHGVAPHNLASQPKVLDGSSRVQIGNRAVAYIGARATCGDVLINGSVDVNIGI